MSRAKKWSGLADVDSVVYSLHRQEPAIDFASEQEADLDSLSNPEVFDRTALEDSVLVSHRTRPAKMKTSTRVL